MNSIWTLKDYIDYLTVYYQKLTDEEKQLPILTKINIHDDIDYSDIINVGDMQFINIEDTPSTEINYYDSIGNCIVI